MRTLEDINKDLDAARAELEPISMEYVKACEKCSKLEDEAEKYKIDNGLYHSMDELKNYIGKEIRSIKLVEKTNDGKLKVETMYNNEIFGVDEYGHLDFSSYEMGIMFWDKEFCKYNYLYHYNSVYHDFVGYLEISFEDD